MPKKNSKIFIVPNRPKYHTDQLYTYKGYVNSVGFTEKRQKLSKWHISLIFDLFQANKLTFNDTMTAFIQLLVIILCSGLLWSSALHQFNGTFDF